MGSPVASPPEQKLEVYSLRRAKTKHEVSPQPWDQGTGCWGPGPLPTQHPPASGQAPSSRQRTGGVLQRAGPALEGTSKIDTWKIARRSSSAQTHRLTADFQHQSIQSTIFSNLFFSLPPYEHATRLPNIWGNGLSSKNEREKEREGGRDFEGLRRSERRRPKQTEKSYLEETRPYAGGRNFPQTNIN